MPRKKKPSPPSAEPAPLSEILEDSPIAETIRESQEETPLTKIMRERGMKTASEGETPRASERLDERKVDDLAGSAELSLDARVDQKVSTRI